MKKLDAYIGKKVKITLFNNKVYSGILAKGDTCIGTDNWTGKGYHVVDKNFGFRKNHVKKIEFEVDTYPYSENYEENGLVYVYLNYKPLKCPHCRNKSGQYYQLDDRVIMCAECKGQIVFVYS